ncbi:unnamed protein product, partial [Rotaria sp. Silwood1]
TITTTIVPDTTTPVPTTATTVVLDTTTPVPTITTTIVPDTTTPVPTTTTPMPTTTTPIPTTTTPIPTTTTPIPTTTTSITTTLSTTSDHFQSTIVTQGIEETSSSNAPIVITTTSTSTTEEPLIPIFSCDFSTNSCFENNEVLITNGNEFTPVDISEPPRAPLSDASSISKPINNNEACQFPYRLPIDNSTNTTSSDIWFCYKNQCLTESQELVNCTSGNYGLITIDPSESNKTIVQSISQEVMGRNSDGEQCLRYYYYFTVYDQPDWGQHISVLIKSDNETDNETEIDRVSFVNMVENRWFSRNKTFNIAFTNYTLKFHFEVTNDNRTNDPALNKTIYFALDNIELFNRNCRSVSESFTGSTTTSESLMTATTKNPRDVTGAPPCEPQNVS